jgi:2-dehydropantoate 2-reductase
MWQASSANMLISIIGAGALGKTYGGLLALAGHEVHFLAHSEYAALQQAASFAIHLKETQTTLTVKPFVIHQDANTLPPSDLVIIALKTTANQEIPSLIKSCLKDTTTVFIIQNGIGCEEWISQFTGQSPIVCGISFIGAYREGIDLNISFLGNLKLAPFGFASMETCEHIRDAFKQSPVPLPITLHDNYKEIRWHKLLWNIPFGALSIIFDMSTHSLAQNEPYRTMSTQLMSEIRLIAKAEGIEIEKAAQQQMIEYTAQAGQYFPTIYRDFHEGKPIEKEYMFDNVLAIANRYNCIVPFLTLIEKELQTLLAQRVQK